MPEGSTSVFKCMLPKRHPNYGKVDKGFCFGVVVVGGETKVGCEIGRSK